jgi:hypothetical protein
MIIMTDKVWQNLEINHHMFSTHVLCTLLRSRHRFRYRLEQLVQLGDNIVCRESIAAAIIGYANDTINQTASINIIIILVLALNIFAASSTNGSIDPFTRKRMDPTLRYSPSVPHPTSQSPPYPQHQAPSQRHPRSQQYEHRDRS